MKVEENSMYLPDSNVLILAFKNHEPEATFLRRQILKRSIVISVVAIAEFLVNATEEQEERFDNLIKEFKTLEIDEQTARIAAKYRKHYSRKSKRIFLIDCFLAAQAKVHNLILVTNNRSDFPMKDIKIFVP